MNNQLITGIILMITGSFGLGFSLTYLLLTKQPTTTSIFITIDEVRKGGDTYDKAVIK